MLCYIKLVEGAQEHATTHFVTAIIGESFYKHRDQHLPFFQLAIDSMRLLRTKYIPG